MLRVLNYALHVRIGTAARICGRRSWCTCLAGPATCLCRTPSTRKRSWTIAQDLVRNLQPLALRLGCFTGRGWQIIQHSLGPGTYYTYYTWHCTPSNSRVLGHSAGSNTMLHTSIVACAGVRSASPICCLVRVQVTSGLATTVRIQPIDFSGFRSRLSVRRLDQYRLDSQYQVV
jgi:hypothetical protein